MVNIDFTTLKETGVCVLGSCNLDLFLYVKDFPKPGETIHAKRLAKDHGGKGANQAIMVSKLSSESKKPIFIGCVGDDGEGTMVRDNFEKKGFQDVDVHLRTLKNINTGHASITVDESGENKIILSNGANFAITKEMVNESLKLATQSCKVFVTQLEIVPELAHYGMKKAQAAGLTTLFNPAPAVPLKELPKDMLKSVDIIIPNETEAEVLTGCTIKNAVDAGLAVSKLREAGAKNVIITLGSEGCVYGYANTVRRIKPQRKVEKVVDTTGAGDCFVGTLAYFLSCGYSIVESIHFANDIAGRSVESFGIQSAYPSRDQLISLNQ